MARRSSWASYAIWGCVAVCAVLGAAFTIALVVGTHRGISIASFTRQSSPTAARTVNERAQERAQATAPVAKPDMTSIEIARLNDALRLLSADRDRLQARLEQIERSVGDITASIKEPPARSPEPPAAPAAPRQQLAAAPTEPTPPPAAQPSRRNQAQEIGDPINIFQPYSSVRPLVGAPSPSQAPMQIEAIARGEQPAPAVTSSIRPEPASSRTDSTATRTEFAVDLGGNSSIDGLRSLWANLQSNHGQTLAGLRPLVSVQEGRRGVELRLVAGPLANAATAARTCAALQAKGVSCQTTVFDGQRLAVR
jgi:hypothetical protein